MISPGLLVRRVLPFALAIGIWFASVPAGLTAQAWHLFAIFVAAIAAVLMGAFPLLDLNDAGGGSRRPTGTISPAKAFAGFANASVLLVVIAFLVTQALVLSEPHYRLGGLQPGDEFRRLRHSNLVRVRRWPSAMMRWRPVRRPASVVWQQRQR